MRRALPIEPRTLIIAAAGVAAAVAAGAAGMAFLDSRPAAPPKAAPALQTLPLQGRGAAGMAVEGNGPTKPTPHKPVTIPTGLRCVSTTGTARPSSADKRHASESGLAGVSG